MPADAADLESAAADYGDEIARTAGGAAILDLVLLGMGPDGHVASLFPAHALLSERDRLVAAVGDSPKPPARRLTLTMPVLTRARRLIIVAFGAAKAAALAEAVADGDSRLPVAIALRESSSALILADQEAGGKIEGQ